MKKAVINLVTHKGVNPNVTQPKFIIDEYIWISIPNLIKHIPGISEHTLRVIISRSEFAHFRREVNPKRIEVLFSPYVLNLIKSFIRYPGRKRRTKCKTT